MGKRKGKSNGKEKIDGLEREIKGKKEKETKGKGKERERGNDS